jgi:hypothetical protein
MTDQDDETVTLWDITGSFKVDFSAKSEGKTGKEAQEKLTELIHQHLRKLKCGLDGVKYSADASGYWQWDTYECGYPWEEYDEGSEEYIRLGGPITEVKSTT